MGKAVWLAITIVCLLCFAGCGNTLALSDRAIVKAVFAEKTGQDYQVAVVIAEEEEKQQSFSLQWAEGETLSQAMYTLEEQGEKKLFYGQNQLLMVGENASQTSLSQALEYFSAEQASRPNMAVYATKMDEDDFKEWANSEAFAEDIRRLEKDLESTEKTARMIFEISTTQEGTQGFVPLLEVTQEGLDTTQLLLYENDRTMQHLEGEQAQIARILLGMQTELTVSQMYEGEDIHFSVDDPQILRTVESGDDGPILRLVMTGTVRGVSADRAQRQAELSSWQSREELSIQISQNISEIFRKTLEKTWNKSDPFGFQWWFSAWNGAKTKQLTESGQLWQYDSIVTNVDIHVI